MLNFMEDLKAIESEVISNGLVDLTGQVAESIDIEPREEFWIIQVYKRRIFNGTVLTLK